MKTQKGSRSGHPWRRASRTAQRCAGPPRLPQQGEVRGSRGRHESSELCSGRGAAGDSQTKPSLDALSPLTRGGDLALLLHTPVTSGPASGEPHVGTRWDRSCQGLAKQRATHAARAGTSPRHQLPGHPGEEFKVFLLIWSSKCFESTKYTIASPLTGATLIKTIDALNESFLAKTLEFWYLLPSSARQSLSLTLQDNGESCFPL